MAGRKQQRSAAQRSAAQRSAAQRSAAAVCFACGRRSALAHSCWFVASLQRQSLGRLPAAPGQARPAADRRGASAAAGRAVVPTGLPCCLRCTGCGCAAAGPGATATRAIPHIRPPPLLSARRSLGKSCVRAESVGLGQACLKQRRGRQKKRKKGGRQKKIKKEEDGRDLAGLAQCRMAGPCLVWLSVPRHRRVRPTSGGDNERTLHAFGRTSSAPSRGAQGRTRPQLRPDGDLPRCR